MPRTTSRSKSKSVTKKVDKAPAKKNTGRSTRKTSTASSKSPARSTKSTAKTTKAPARSSTRSTKAPAKNTKAAPKTTKSTSRGRTPTKNTKSTAKSTAKNTKTTATRGKSKSAASKSKAPATKGKGRGRSASKKTDKDDDDDEEEEDEEEEETKPTRPGRGRKAAPKKKETKSKLGAKIDAKISKKGKKAASSDDEEEEEEEEEEKDDKKSRGKSGKRGRGKSHDDDLDDEGDGADKGGKKKKLDLDSIEVHVDEHCPRNSDLNVYIKGNKIYDAKLNQSNVNANNNKFYVIQLLQHKTNKGQFFVYNRWGRVGVTGQDKFMGPMGEDSAIKEYEKKLREKSVKGDYRVLEMDYSKDTTAEAAQAMATGLKSSKLKKPVADLVSLIFDTTMANKQMESIGYDTKKLPLGKLSSNNIQKGYKILKEILDEIQSKGKKNRLEELSSDFYSYIPHDVGFTNMQSLTIRDEETVKKKLDLLDSLSNVKETFALIQKKGEGDNVVDANYHKLKCKIDPVEKDSSEYKMIQTFITNTSQGSKASILHAYKIDREGEDARYTKKIDNKILLWHGSRLANFVGILSQGLRIAPPEAPASGYRFGKGIYLADMFAKSYGYCRSWGSDSFCIMLCEGALGTPNELLHDDFNANKLPKGKHSTKALGHVAPHEKHHKEIMKGVMIPQGKPEKTPHSNSSCSHNEFIIYDVNQVRIRYLLWMKESR